MDWDARYRAQDRLFSGNPNGVLVTEAAALPPGRALDAGCGEGADALWLAARGWTVTAMDIAPTALARAAEADVEGRVTWTESDLSTTSPPPGIFDLVSIQYFPLAPEPDHKALRGLLDAVAPGGTLLFVTHDLSDLPDPAEFDKAGYYWPQDVADLLDDTWTIVTNGQRPRTTPPPPGTHHRHDLVLRARRA
ncbi:class I SAM-dependent methyltransferase [Dactylosporangium sp. CA-233914]|uniref:class I SAM-dependent methyltransferase n=1 Tax=Dactylosporangium sp. CA-233914 TaxID=3239934 RepID=UPI003D8A4BF6